MLTVEEREEEVGVIAEEQLILWNHHGRRPNARHQILSRSSSIDQHWKCVYFLLRLDPIHAKVSAKVLCSVISSPFVPSFPQFSNTSLGVMVPYRFSAFEEEGLMMPVE